MAASFSLVDASSAALVVWISRKKRRSETAAFKSWSRSSSSAWRMGQVEHPAAGVLVVGWTCGASDAFDVVGIVLAGDMQTSISSFEMIG